MWTAHCSPDMDLTQGRRFPRGISMFISQWLVDFSKVWKLFRKIALFREDVFFAQGICSALVNVWSCISAVPLVRCNRGWVSCAGWCVQSSFFVLRRTGVRRDGILFRLSNRIPAVVPLGFSHIEREPLRLYGPRARKHGWRFTARFEVFAQNLEYLAALWSDLDEKLSSWS